MRQISLLLLLEEIDTKWLHQRSERIGDIRQGLRSFYECIQELAARVDDLFGHNCANELIYTEYFRHNATVVRCTLEEYRVGGDVDGMQILNVLRRPTYGVC